MAVYKIIFINPYPVIMKILRNSLFGMCVNPVLVICLFVLGHL